EEGCFGWTGTALHRISSIAIADSNGDGTERTPRDFDKSHNEEDDEVPLRLGTERPREPISPWIRWSVTILSYLSVLILGFLISYSVFCLLNIIPVDPSTR